MFSFAVLAAGWALYDRFEQTNERREHQARVTAALAGYARQIAEQSLANCREIESLKAVHRVTARTTYRNRERNFRLLGLTLSPELERIAVESRDAILERFKAEPCPRKIIRR
jgi:hypothetical protein